MLAKGFSRCLVLAIAAVMVPLMLVQSVLTRLPDTTVVSPFCPCKLRLQEQPLGLFRPWHLSILPGTHFPSGNWRLRSRAAPPQSVPEERSASSGPRARDNGARVPSWRSPSLSADSRVLSHWKSSKDVSLPSLG